MSPVIAADECSDRFLDLHADSAATERDPETFRDERGRTVGQFRLLEQIGEGGTGVVYGAQRARLRTPTPKR